MLNIGVLAGVTSVDYYLAQVASGVEDYYTGRGEAPGWWTGAATTTLGLAGEVDADVLRAVLGGVDPRSGDPMGRWRSGRKVPGFDLTFRAPKSASLLWALSDRDTSIAVQMAHDAAVAAAVAYLESAVGSRCGQGGCEDVAVRGFVAAAFRHRASRAGDPLLHTHVLIANAVQAVDDNRWRTIDSRGLFRHAKTAGYLYQAQLRHELTRRVGVAWQPVTNGYADIAGIPKTLVRAFSQRRTQIEQRMAQRGESSAKAAQVATLDTRRPKHHVDPLTLVDRWRDRAVELGHGPDDLATVIGRRGCQPPPQPVLDDAVAAVAEPDGVTRQRSMFTRRDVIQHLCSHVDAAADATQILACADTAIAGTEVVGLQSRRREQHYSTRELLAVERRLIATIEAQRGRGVGLASQRVVDAAVARRPTLHPEQTEMIRRLCRDGDGIAVVVGKAGTGKTFALTAAADAWEHSRIKVIGCALSGNAANQLADATGITCSTIASLLRWLDHPTDHGGLSHRSVVVVDEAGMVGTRTLARLAAHTAAAGAKLVLVGDHHQLPEIDAGGAFAGLAARATPITLEVNRRQHHRWERDALDHLRDGTSVAAVVRGYRDHHRLTIADTADELRARLVGDWWDAYRNRGPAAGIMVALRVAEIDDLNHRARSHLAHAGLLTGPTLTTVDDGVEFQRGDRVVTRLGATLCASGGGRVAVANGQRGTISRVDPDRRAVTVTFDRAPSGGLMVPAGYLDAGHLHHGYAITGHRAQGLTADRCWVLFSDALYRQWGYVALSRAREHTQIYLVAGDEHDTDDVDLDRHGIQPDGRSPTTRVTDWLDRSKAQQLALDFTLTAEDR